MKIRKKQTKNIFALAICCAFIFSLCLSPACEETPPYIDFSEPDTTNVDTMTSFLDVPLIYNDTTFVDVPLTTQEKVVFIEEFSGVRCVNCPAGQQQVKDILDANSGRVIAASIYAGPSSLAAPYPDSNENYILTEGSFLYDFLGVLGLPAAAVDRVLFEGESNVGLITQTKWASKVALQLQQIPPVNVYLYYQYNENNRLLNVYVQLRYTQSFEEEHQLSVMLTENNIVDLQLIPDGQSSKVQDDYVHNHVMRAMLTPATGISLTTNQPVGTAVVKAFTITLADNWKFEDCEIIAFVHQSGATKAVMQAAAVHLE